MKDISDFSKYITFDPLRRINHEERRMLYSEEDYWDFRKSWITAGISGETLDHLLSNITIIDEDAFQYGTQRMTDALLYLRNYADKKQRTLMSLNDGIEHSTGFFKEYVANNVNKQKLYPSGRRLFSRQDMPVCVAINTRFHFPLNTLIVVLDDWSITGCNHDNEVFTVKEHTNLTERNMFFGYLGLTPDGALALKRNKATLIANSFLIPHACDLLEQRQVDEINDVFEYDFSTRLGADTLTFAYGETYKDIPDNFANFFIHPYPDKGFKKSLITIPADAK